MEPPDPASADGPPADPEDWTNEQWIEWLNATDAQAGVDRDDPPVTPIGRIARSSGGQVLGQAMLGMANAIFGRQDDEVVIVSEGDTEPDPDEPFTVHLDPDHPERSTVVFRPGVEPPPPAPT
jgi:hypothetical protein